MRITQEKVTTQLYKMKRYKTCNQDTLNHGFLPFPLMRNIQNLPHTYIMNGISAKRRNMMERTMTQNIPPIEKIMSTAPIDRYTSEGRGLVPNKMTKYIRK